MIEFNDFYKEIFYGNTLILGVPGTGKTCLLKRIIERFDEENITYYISDPKNLEFIDNPCVKDIDATVDLLIKKSKEIFCKCKIEKPIFLVADEISDDIDKNKLLSEKINELIVLSKGKNIHLVLASQRSKIKRIINGCEHIFVLNENHSIIKEK